MSELKEYWEKQLSGELPLLDLPSSLSRSSIKDYNFSTYRFVIDTQLITLLEHLAYSENVRLENLLLATFKVLLYRYTNEQDILVGLLLNQQDNCPNVVISRNFITEDI
jgi:hypothetical protein